MQLNERQFVSAFLRPIVSFFGTYFAHPIAIY